MAIIFGNESEFLSSGAVDYSSVASLTASGFVVAYRDGAEAGRGTVRIGTISGTIITFGDEKEFTYPFGAKHISVASLGTSGFVVAYQDAAVSNHGTAKIGSISGTDITLGSKSEFYSSNYADHIDVASLSTSGFVVVYRTKSIGGSARIGTILGTDITLGDAAIIASSGSILNNSVTVINPSTFVVAYHDLGNSGKGTARVGTISGTDITFGTQVEFTNPDAVGFLSIIKLDDTRFVIAFGENGDQKGRAVIGSISGTDIIFGDKVEFLDGILYGIDVTALSECAFITTYSDGATSRHGKARIGIVNNTNIVFGNTTEFLSTGTVGKLSVDTIDDDTFVVVYEDQPDSDHGTAKIGTIIPPPPNACNMSDLFISGPKLETASGNLFICGTMVTKVIVSGNLFIHGHTDMVASGDLLIEGHIPTTTSNNLFIYGYQNSIVSGDLFIHGHINYTASGNLFIDGHIDSSGIPAPSLFIHGYDTVSVSGDTFVHGYETIDTSGDLYIGGIVPEPSAVIRIARPLDWLLKTQDHNPQIIGSFDMFASSATIQVWDVTNGQNTLITLAASGCYAIGNTDRWGWSTANLPTTQGFGKHYFYQMTSNFGEIFEGQMILDIPEGAKWIHPGSQSEYLV